MSICFLCLASFEALRLTISAFASVVIILFTIGHIPVGLRNYSSKAGFK